MKPAHELVAPLQGPSRLNSPVTNGPLLPLGGAAAQEFAAVAVSQKIVSSVRLSPFRTAGLRPTLSESWGAPDPPIGLGPWWSVL
jgi:hypothetical protein